MPLSGEAIRTMNYVDDISVTLRRILAVLPSLTDEERQRVSEHIKHAEPSYDTVIDVFGDTLPLFVGERGQHGTDAPERNRDVVNVVHGADGFARERHGYS